MISRNKRRCNLGAFTVTELCLPDPLMGVHWHHTCSFAIRFPKLSIRCVCWVSAHVGVVFYVQKTGFAWGLYKIPAYKRGNSACALAGSRARASKAAALEEEQVLSESQKSVCWARSCTRCSREKWVPCTQCPPINDDVSLCSYPASSLFPYTQLYSTDINLEHSLVHVDYLCILCFCLVTAPTAPSVQWGT